MPISGHAPRSQEFRLNGEAATDRLAAAVAAMAQPRDVILLKGDLGTGKTRFARGFADLATQRRETARAKCVLGLVREANRDGHSMRTHEVPAMRGLLLAQRTPQHPKRAELMARAEAIQARWPLPATKWLRVFKPLKP